MFEIYKKKFIFKDVSGREEEYLLRPISGRFLPKLFSIIKKLAPEGEVKEIKPKDMDEDAMGLLHELILETFKKSYPEKKEDELDMWVSQNLMALVEPFLEVNMRLPNE